METLREKYGKVIAPHFMPIREMKSLWAMSTFIKNAGRRYTDIGKREECEIPDYCMDYLQQYREALMDL